MEAYDVFLPRDYNDDEWIDTVFAIGYNEEEIRKSLINHDGYDPSIIVKKKQ